MGFIDWIKGAGQSIASGAKWLGDKVGKGLEWVDQKIQPALNFARSIPVVGNIVDAAKPLTDLGGKVGRALQGKGGLGFSDISDAALAIPGTIAAAKTGINIGRGYASRARSMVPSA